MQIVPRQIAMSREGVWFGPEEVAGEYQAPAAALYTREALRGSALQIRAGNSELSEDEELYDEYEGL